MITIYVTGLPYHMLNRVAGHCVAQFGLALDQSRRHAYVLVEYEHGVARVSAPDQGDLQDASVNATGSLYRSVPLFPDVFTGYAQESMFDVPSYLAVASSQSPYNWLWRDALPSVLPDRIVRMLHEEYRMRAAAKSRSMYRARKKGK
jgi:hypothetical protein